MQKKVCCDIWEEMGCVTCLTCLHLGPFGALRELRAQLELNLER